MLALRQWTALAWAVGHAVVAAGVGVPAGPVAVAGGRWGVAGVAGS